MNCGVSKFCGFWLILLIFVINLELAVGLKCEFDYSGNSYLCNVILDLRSIEEDHFYGNTDDDVESIRFNGTIKESTPFCQRFKNVKKIEIVKKDSVDANLFQDCENLKEVRVSFTNIEEIPENLFIEHPQLTEINLSRNKLKTLPKDIFSNQEELEYLYLEQNQISCLPSNIFKSLIKLQQINLIRNKIEDLPKNVFKNLRNLKWLYLSDNQLTTIHSDSFGNLRKLLKINLSYNKINAIDEKIIENTAVSEFNMGGNVCSNENIKKRHEIVQELSTCFENYQPRQNSELCSNEFFRPTETTTTKFVRPTQTTTTTTMIACGTRHNFVIGLIHGGTLISRGEFPWNVVLIKSNGDLFCGGTLVSNRHVVTAAHCIKGKNGNHEYGTEDFSVILGVHNYKKLDELGRISAKVKSINVHQHWNIDVPSFDADIAILELIDEVEFSNYIQPICLADDDSEVAEASTGTVIGFGLTENGSLVNIANKLDISIRDYRDCIVNSTSHQTFASARTFCGGPADGRGVCTGDSGSGVYVLHKDVFYLRGLVSSSLVNNRYECDTHKEAIFTDVTQFYNWIDFSIKAHFDEHSTTATSSTTKRTSTTSSRHPITSRTTVKYNFDGPIWI